MHVPGKDTLNVSVVWGVHLRSDQRLTLAKDLWINKHSQHAIHEHAHVIYLSGQKNRKMKRTVGVSEEDEGSCSCVNEGWMMAALSEGHLRFNPCKIVPCLNPQIKGVISEIVSNSVSHINYLCDSGSKIWGFDYPKVTVPFRFPTIHSTLLMPMIKA